MIFFLKKIYYSIFNKDYNFTKTLINQYYTGKKKTVLSFSSIGAGTKYVQNEEFFKDEVKGSVAASDAFFPFADGLNELIKIGVKCIIQPGGSIKDDEVIAAAEKAGIAMVFTGIRSFRH